MTVVADKQHPLEVEVDELREKVKTQAEMIERLSLRVLTKDAEFAKERRLWKAREYRLLDEIRTLKRKR